MCEFIEVINPVPILNVRKEVEVTEVITNSTPAEF
jgi:hypothetical protein